MVVNIAEEYNNHFEKVVEFIRKLDKEKREVVQQKANEYKEILAWKSVCLLYTSSIQQNQLRFDGLWWREKHTKYN